DDGTRRGIAPVVCEDVWRRCWIAAQSAVRHVQWQRSRFPACANDAGSDKRPGARSHWFRSKEPRGVHEEAPGRRRDERCAVSGGSERRAEDRVHSGSCRDADRADRRINREIGTKMHKIHIKLFALFVPLCGYFLAQAQVTVAPGKKAGEVFKNVTTT